jgi:thioredoxin-related protein
MYHFLIFLCFNLSFSFGQSTYTFEEAEQKLNKEEKLIFVYIHAPWCMVCHLMEESTLKDTAVIQLLNQGYYVFFDAESKTQITFRGKTFNYQATGNTGIHELASHLGTIDNELVFPTFVILNANNEILFQQAGLLDAIALQRVLEASLKISD